MTGPTVDFEVRESTRDFGPDVSGTPDAPPKPRRKSAAREKAEKFVGGLGLNQGPTRGPVRALKTEDIQGIAVLYQQLAMPVGMFHPKLGQAMAASAESCAVAWGALAEKNVGVRRFWLGVLEGGQWGQVILCHMPMFMAVVPEDVLQRFFMRGMDMFGQQAESTPDGGPDYREYPPDASAA